LSFFDEHIIDKAARLGVSLGDSTHSSMLSARLIKESETNRQLHIIENNLNRGIDGDDPASLVLSRASCLS
jgi:hypothetical protein